MRLYYSIFNLYKVGATVLPKNISWYRRSKNGSKSLWEGIFVDDIGANCTNLEIVRAKNIFYVLKSLS